MLDVHIKNPKPMKYVPAQLSSFLRCNKIEKCLFRLSGLFGLTELNSALLAAFLSLRLTHSTFVLDELSNLLLFLRCFLDVLTATKTVLTDFPLVYTKFLQCVLGLYLKTEATASLHTVLNSSYHTHQFFYLYEGWNFNSGNYLFTTDTK